MSVSGLCHPNADGVLVIVYRTPCNLNLPIPGGSPTPRRPPFVPCKRMPNPRFTARSREAGRFVATGSTRDEQFHPRRPVSLSPRAWVALLLPAPVDRSMLEGLEATCGDGDCDRPLTDDRLMIEMHTEGGIRRAYECRCGAVTVALVAPENGS